MEIERKEMESLHPHLRESWFKAYKDANILMPLRFNGMVVFLAEALYKDRPENLEEFSRAEFSEEQLEFLVTVAKGVHERYGLNPTARHKNEIGFYNQIKEHLNSVKGLVKKFFLYLDDMKHDPQDLNQFMDSEKGRKVGEVLEEIVHLFRNNSNLKDLVKKQHETLSTVESSHISTNIETIKKEFESELLKLFEDLQKDEESKGVLRRIFNFLYYI